VRRKALLVAIKVSLPARGGIDDIDDEATRPWFVGTLRNLILRAQQMMVATAPPLRKLARLCASCRGTGKLPAYRAEALAQAEHAG
jgi:hypothetical protein